MTYGIGTPPDRHFTIALILCITQCFKLLNALDNAQVINDNAREVTKVTPLAINDYIEDQFLYKQATLSNNINRLINILTIKQIHKYMKLL